jgi:hypothetical protein
MKCVICLDNLECSESGIRCKCIGAKLAINGCIYFLFSSNNKSIITNSRLKVILEVNDNINIEQLESYLNNLVFC